MEKVRKLVIEIVGKYVMLNNEDENLYEQSLTNMGMESISFVRIIIDLEEQFEIEIPDELLIRSGLDTIQRITEVVFAIVKDNK